MGWKEAEQVITGYTESDLYAHMSCMFLFFLFCSFQLGTLWFKPGHVIKMQTHKTKQKSARVHKTKKMCCYSIASVGLRCIVIGEVPYLESDLNALLLIFIVCSYIVFSWQPKFRVVLYLSLDNLLWFMDCTTVPISPRASFMHRKYQLELAHWPPRDVNKLAHLKQLPQETHLHHKTQT